MGMTLNGGGSSISSGISQGTLNIKNQNNPAVRMSALRSSGRKMPKKKLNYNPREISSQLMRASKSRNASTVLIRAKSKVSVLHSALATGQYDDAEVRTAIAHARRMVECSRLKVRNLKEEESMKKRNDKTHSTEQQRKKNEVKRRVSQKEQQLKTKMAVEKNQQILKEKSNQQELRRKRRMHRNQELGKITEADMKYLEDQMKNNQGNSSVSYSGVVLDLSQTAAQMTELQMMESQIEQQVEAEVEMEMAAIDAGFTGTDLGAGDAGTGTMSGDAGGTAAVTLDVSV